MSNIEMRSSQRRLMLRRHYVSFYDLCVPKCSANNAIRGNKMLRLGIAVFATVALGQILPVQAAEVQVTGKALALALYGHEHMGKLTNGDSFDVSYDAKGVQSAGGKKTGAVMKATATQWCAYTKKKTPDYCVLIYKDGSTYTSRDPKTPTVILGTFNVK